jgi:hypothetical protein
MPSAKRMRIAAMREAQIMYTKSTKMPRQSNRLALPRSHNTCLISQEAIAHLITTEQTKDKLSFTPFNLRKYGPPPHDLEHYAMPMIHPVTGKSISSYKYLMNDPATADTWMTAFSKNFGVCVKATTKQDSRAQM